MHLSTDLHYISPPKKKKKIVAMKPEVLLRSDNFVLMSWVEGLNEQCAADGVHVKSP